MTATHHANFLNEIARQMATCRPTKTRPLRPASATPAAPAVAAELLTSEDAAALLGVTTRTLRTWDIPRFQHGRIVRYRRADLDAFIAARMVGGDTLPPTTTNPPEQDGE
jgi:hypothetical protein